MGGWLTIAALGLILSVWGIMVVTRRYRSQEVTGLYLLALVLGYVAFLVIALVNAFAPQFTRGPVGVVIWIPLLIAIVLLLRERGKSTDQSGS